MKRFIYSLIYLEVSYREGSSTAAELAVWLPKTKAGASRKRGLHPGLHEQPGAQTLEPSSAAFPGHRQGAGLEAEDAELEPVSIWDVCSTDASFACFAAILVPVWYFNRGKMKAKMSES